MKNVRSKSWQIFLVVLCLCAALAAFFFVSRPQPLWTCHLLDGTQVTIDSLQTGKEFRIYSGTSLQRGLFRVVGSKAPYRLVGTESSFPASLTNANGKSFGLILRRFADHGFLSTAWNGGQGLVLLNEDGKEIAGIQLLVNFDSGIVDEKTKITAEQILWEFPPSAEKELHFRLYDTNRTSRTVSTNEFFLKNPTSSL